MRKKTKNLAVMIGISLIVSMLSGCSVSNSAMQDKEIAVVENGSSDTNTDVLQETENTSVSEVSIEEQILYDGNDIKITATGMEDSIWGAELKLLIENNSSKTITVQARNCNVNGYMVTTMMSADVASGKKANDSLTFETSGLKESGIEQIATMEFYFHIFDTETWDTIVDTDVITIQF